jgi:hypothetical protein
MRISDVVTIDTAQGRVDHVCVRQRHSITGDNEFSLPGLDPAAMRYLINYIEHGGWIAESRSE